MNGNSPSIVILHLDYVYFILLRNFTKFIEPTNRSVQDSACGKHVVYITGQSRIVHVGNLWYISCSLIAWLQILLVAKGIAVALSSSVSIISSLVDSAVDLLSGIIIWWTSRAMKNRNIYEYPGGKFCMIYARVVCFILYQNCLLLVSWGLFAKLSLAYRGNSLTWNSRWH